MKKRALQCLFTIVPIAFVAGGCASLPAVPNLLNSSSPPQHGFLTGTSVEQRENNYRIVKPNAVGTAKGFKLLGLISLKSANYSKALTQLYSDGVMEPGKAQALANVVHEKSSTYFILFSIPKVTVRADVIEYTAASGTK